MFFPKLFMLNILCDVIHDVTDKHDGSGFGRRTVSEMTAWLQLLQRRVDTLNNIWLMFYVL